MHRSLAAATMLVCVTLATDREVMQLDAAEDGPTPTFGYRVLKTYPHRSTAWLPRRRIKRQRYRE